MRLACQRQEVGISSHSLSGASWTDRELMSTLREVDKASLEEWIAQQMRAENIRKRESTNRKLRGAIELQPNADCPPTETYDGTHDTLSRGLQRWRDVEYAGAETRTEDRHGVQAGYETEYEDPDKQKTSLE